MKGTFIRRRLLLIIFGLFLSILLIEVGLRLGGFIYLSLQKHRNRISLMHKGVFRIICLGGSNTALGGRYSYPSQLEEILNQRKLGIKFDVLNLGVPGMHSGSIVAQLEENLDRYKPDMVCVMMGINDLGNLIPYRYVPDTKMMQFVRSLRIYKLVRLLWLHSVNRTRKTGIYKSKNAIPKREDILKRTIERNPKSGWAYLELGLWYLDLREKKKAREMFERALQLGLGNKWVSAWVYFILGFTEEKINIAQERIKKLLEVDPHNDWNYFVVGWWYRYLGMHERAEAMFKKAIEVDPESALPYLALARLYKAQRNYNQAREMFERAVDAFKKAIEVDSGQAWPYMELGWWYNRQENEDRARERLKRTIEKSPQDGWAYVELMKLYRKQGQYDKVTEIFEKAAEIDSKNVWAYFELAKSFRDQGEYAKAAEAIQRGIEINSVKDALYSGLAMCYEELGRHGLAQQYLDKARSLRRRYYNPMTRYNYRKLKEIVTQRKIKLVVIQYPMRDVELLKRLFEDKEGIVFVDNENIFREAVRQGSYEEYFVNSFAGDFGHCTPKGNRLLAQNVAEAIIEKFFK
jgi:tetratricopeptide (TPR) repeat protein